MLVRYSEDERNPRKEVLGSKQDHVKVGNGDVLEWITWGGGGYGDALTRDPAVVALEVRRGLVSVDGAKRYGVVIRVGKEDEEEAFSVDEEATENLRRKMAKAKEGVKQELCNRGGTWEELKAKALEETGLPAPKWPWEVPLRGPMTGLPHIREWMERHGQKVTVRGGK